MILFLHCFPLSSCFPGYWYSWNLGKSYSVWYKHRNQAWKVLLNINFSGIARRNKVQFFCFFSPPSLNCFNFSKFHVSLPISPSPNFPKLIIWLQECLISTLAFSDNHKSASTFCQRSKDNCLHASVKVKASSLTDYVVNTMLF